MADETTPEQKREDEELESQETSGSVTRRQFLIGAGVGAVVGAAGVGGVLAFAKPTPATPQVTQAQTAPIPQTGQQQIVPIVSDLPATMRRVTLDIDNKKYDVIVDVRMSLWEVMTYHLGLASSNLGCDRAQCGACTILVDGRAMNGCTLLAARLGRGQKIVTVDGISKGAQLDQLHPVAQAFHQEGGYQCGICTRGFIMSTYALLSKNPNPTEDDVREALAGNICRCSEYPKIYESVFLAAEKMRKKA
ncbi:MAG: (2Fe-2S)-binding protein [Chloroflexi bacterium]|nr:(2Fe-2S)-binding protein [Chloroflexota bacterium]